MAQQCNHIRKKQKPSFNGKDHLKLLLSQMGIILSLALIDLRLLEVKFIFYDCTIAYKRHFQLLMLKLLIIWDN